MEVLGSVRLRRGVPTPPLPLPLAVERYTLTPPTRTRTQVIQFIRLSTSHRVPPGYAQQFRHAELTFLHQRVWCPVRRELVHLHPVPEGLDAERDLPFVGA